jgi:predicted AAA+ superfamily ATPase
MKDRKLYRGIWDELSKEKAMIFLAGPRQSGKTTLARMISSQFTNQIYFNWDLMTNKKLLVEKPTFFDDVNKKDLSTPLVVFDEIHKYRRWKNYLKGIYDQFSDRYKFLVLGSGRLNVFQKGGDSLAGRYYMFTLWPFTVAELAGEGNSFKEFVKAPLALWDHQSADRIWDQLSTLSGFPEPYLSGKEAVYRRWTRTYHQQLIREDIRNMTEIKNVDDTEILFSLLSSKVGNPLSMDSLARDVQVSFKSVRNWLEIFETFFLTFRISPWTRKISRLITKERKLYFYDYAGIPSPSAKFENMVALELLRAISHWNDLGWGDFALHYIRNKEKEEVDFLISNNHSPFLLVETKLSDDEASRSLVKFQPQLKVPAVQLVNKPDICKLLSNDQQKILVVSASRWLAGLP